MTEHYADGDLVNGWTPIGYRPGDESRCAGTRCPFFVFGVIVLHDSSQKGISAEGGRAGKGALARLTLARPLIVSNIGRLSW